MNHHKLTAAQRRAARFCARGLLIAGLAAAVTGCQTTANDTTCLLYTSDAADE